ncbi:MAG: DUF192 domain-containing protein [Bacteroidota bacterium]
MRKKPIIYIGVGLIGVALLAFLFLPKLNQRKFNDLNAVEGKVFEVPFKKQGELSFYDQESREVIKTIDLEFAENEQAITQGLMFRQDMTDEQGMIFVFEAMEPRSFWMKNTFVSLDIIFVDDLNQIVSIQEKTTPRSQQSLPSKGPAQYVVEVLGGFCERYGIEAGDKITFQKGSRRASTP